MGSRQMDTQSRFATGQEPFWWLGASLESSFSCKPSSEAFEDAASLRLSIPSYRGPDCAVVEALPSLHAVDSTMELGQGLGP